MIPEPKGKKKSRDVEHKSLSVSRLQEMVDNEITHVASIVGLEVCSLSFIRPAFVQPRPPQTPIVSILLRHFNWNQERLIERFLESADRVLHGAGEPVDDDAACSDADGSPRPAKRPRLAAPGPGFACAVCCDDEPPAVLRLRCGHAFCTSCWREYAETKIRAEGECAFLCMHDGCTTVVDASAVGELVEPEVYERCVFSTAIAVYPVPLSLATKQRVIN